MTAKKTPRTEYVDISSLPFDVRDKAIKRTEKEMHPLLTSLHIPIVLLDLAILMILLSLPTMFLFSIADSLFLRVAAGVFSFLWIGLLLHYMINIRDKKYRNILYKHIRIVQKEQEDRYS